jgi:hypothetical protein
MLAILQGLDSEWKIWSQASIPWKGKKTLNYDVALQKESTITSLKFKNLKVVRVELKWYLKERAWPLLKPSGKQKH